MDVKTLLITRAKEKKTRHDDAIETGDVYRQEQVANYLIKSIIS